MAVDRLTSEMELLTTKEAARMLNVHENTLRRWCDQGIIVSLRIGERGDRRMRRRDIEALAVNMRQNNGYGRK